MDVYNELPLKTEIKQEQDCSSFNSESFDVMMPQTDAFTTNNINKIGLNYVNNNNNTENDDEILSSGDHKERELQNIRNRQKDFMDNTSEELQVSNDQVSQSDQISQSDHTSQISVSNSTQSKKIFSGQCPAQWPHAATRLLIELYKKHEDIFESPIINKKDSWKRISAILASHGYPYPPSVCDSKFRALKYRYNLLKESNGKATPGRRKWEFFPLMDELMANSASLKKRSVCNFPGNVSIEHLKYKTSSQPTRKTVSQIYTKNLTLKNRSQNILSMKTSLENQICSPERKTKIPTPHELNEKLTESSRSFLLNRSRDSSPVIPRPTFLPKNRALPGITLRSSDRSSDMTSSETSSRVSVNTSVENFTSNRPPSWFLKFQEESLKRLTQIEQLEQRKVTAYESRNLLIDQRTKVLANISRSLERVAQTVEKNSNGTCNRQNDLLLTFSELLKRIENT